MSTCKLCSAFQELPAECIEGHVMSSEKIKEPVECENQQ